MNATSKVHWHNARDGGATVDTSTIRLCDELGVCQSITKTCPPHTICARKSAPFYFAPGAIDAGADEPRQQGDWLLDTTWVDWAAGVLILAILGAICGWLQ